MPPHNHHIQQMENPIQTFPTSPQLSTQGYSSHSQLQSPTWNGSPVRQNNQAQNPAAEPYPQSMTRYYQGSYIPHQNSSEMSQYANTPNNHQAYNSQYPTSRQTNYGSTNLQQTYPAAALKTNYNVPYYGNVPHQAIYSTADNVNLRQSNYASSPFYPSKTAQCSNSAVHHLSSNNNAATGVQQQSSYAKQQQTVSYSRYSGYSTYPGDNHIGFGGKQLSTPATAAVSSSSSVVPMMTVAQTNGQLSSIPTPPETSGPGELPCNDGATIDGIADCGKMNQMSRSSFVLPGSTVTQNSVSFSSANVTTMTTVSNSSDSSRAQNWTNGSVPLQPPPNVDEGSQASSASASSSIPEEQNSMKANSKPNFSYPPTPNTLSSPGAASMSSFHDDLECISSPGWPRTPASPVATNTNNYEFANIKRPESLLKLYSLSDEPDRRYFLDKLIVFNEDRGSPITQCPTISKQPLDVFRVYLAVKERGGFVEVTNAKRWKDIAGAIGVGASSSAAYTLRKQYMKLLLPFECKYDRGGIDPQPIINQVEASSRKKGKNTASGNPNMCLQGYPQAMDGYPAGYQDCYSASRYSCNSNNMDYRYSQTPSHYPQAVHHSGNNTAAVNNHSQYGQYSQQNNQAAYGYYQGSGSTTYNNNNSSSHSNATSNMCRYTTSSTPSPNVNTPPESSYYNPNYAMQQNYSPTVNNVYKYNNSSSYNNSNSSEEVPTAAAHSNQTVIKQTQPNNYDAYQNKPSALNSKGGSTVSENVSTPKVVESSFESASNDCSVKSESNSSNSNESNYSHNYGMSKSPMQDPPLTPTISSSSTKPVPLTQQSFQATSADSNKGYQPNCRATPTPPTSTPNNNTTNSPNMPTNYTNPAVYQNAYQQRMQNHSSQYGQYVNSPSENYRGSEGPPIYTNQPQAKYNCAANGSKEVPNSHPSPYSGHNQPSKGNAYGSYTNYSSVQSSSKEQFQMSYHKDVYNSTNVKAMKGWGPNSSYPYQSSDVASANTSSQSVGPEKKHFSSETLTPFVPAESPQVNSRKQLAQATPPPPPATPASSSAASVHYAAPNKMSQHQTNSLASAHCYMPTLKKPIEFPSGSVEAVKPVFRKRRRYSAKRVSPLDPWRLMLALKSGLLVESTWALDALSVLLCDNSSAVYFRLSHLPGLLSILVEHYRRFLNKIFGLFDDLELSASNKAGNSSSKNNNTSGLQKEGKKSNSFNWHKKSKVLDSPNYTFKTRCKKNVNIQYDEALFLIDPEQKWDKYEGFEVNSNHWLTGCGEITDHIQIPFESESGKVRFARDMDKEQAMMGKDSNNNTSVKDNLASNHMRDSKFSHPPMSCIGEPIILLKKCNILRKVLSKESKPEEKLNSDAENSRTSMENDSEGSPARTSGGDHKPSVVSLNKSIPLNFVGVGSNSEITVCNSDIAGNASVEKCHVVEQKMETVVKSENLEVSTSKQINVDSAESVVVKPGNDVETEETAFPRLRCPTPQKRVHADELEDEAYCLDNPSLNLSTDYQEALIRRCMCVSNILRNLSFVPGNDLEMNKHSCFLLVLGRLLLLYHEHKPVKSTHRKYDKETESGTMTDDSCVSLREDNEWRGSLLHVLRDNTLVVFSNIAGQLDLTPFPEEISLPILDGLLHWVTCPSSYARDPLPVKPSLSVLTPQRLSLETLCKLSVLDNNVDLMVATPPWSRIEHLFELLVRSLGPVEDKVAKEFAIVLLSSLSQADSSVARTIASQNQCISYLIGFIEQAEAAAFQIASTQGAKKLKDNPEIVGTTPNMVQRVANILNNLALVPENRLAFFRHQQRLLTLATSQIIDQELATIIAEVLFYCSGDTIDGTLPIPFLHS